MSVLSHHCCEFGFIVFVLVFFFFFNVTGFTCDNWYRVGCEEDRIHASLKYTPPPP